MRVRAWRMRRTTPKKRCVRHLLQLSKVVGSVPTNEITLKDYINRLEMSLYRGVKVCHADLFHFRWFISHYMEIKVMYNP